MTVDTVVIVIKMTQIDIVNIALVEDPKAEKFDGKHLSEIEW